MKITEITKCRVCGNTDLIKIMDLGLQPLSGIFPKVEENDPPSAPLILVKCNNQTNAKYCGLVQLKHSVDPEDMFQGGDYGYRSGLNQTMTTHLESITEDIMRRVRLNDKDIVVDIGSNDGTLLKSYTKHIQIIGGYPRIRRCGIDPGGKQYKKYYPSDIALIPEFFPSETFKITYKGEKAKVITSIAMFYDLEDPMVFVKNIKETLHPDGMWVLEQSYLPTMLTNNSFDTICHEHLEYYALAQIEWMCIKNGLKIIDVVMNNINGGSFRCYVAHTNSPHTVNTDILTVVHQHEDAIKLNTTKPFKAFVVSVLNIKEHLKNFIRTEKHKGKKIYVYGASTKGNILLNYFDLDVNFITAAADRNPDKWIRKTPGTHIPIISEEQARIDKPDYFLVLPWHFKKEFINREKEYLESGGKFIFPLPNFEIVGAIKYGKEE